MGSVYKEVSQAALISAAEDLRKVNEAIVSAATGMMHRGMATALFKWTQRQWDALDVLKTLGAEVEKDAGLQFSAKDQGRPSSLVKKKRKSQNDAAVKAVRKKRAVK